MLGSWRTLAAVNAATPCGQRAIGGGMTGGRSGGGGLSAAGGETFVQVKSFSNALFNGDPNLVGVAAVADSGCGSGHGQPQLAGPLLLIHVFTMTDLGADGNLPRRKEDPDDGCR
jgi:hypothetical protein